jgi:cob(I)alamin adenosyltransferase
MAGGQKQIEKKVKKGLLMVYTGDGKGKTTAALGMTLRTVGHGLKVCFIQFIKGSWKYGELEAVRRFEGLIDFHVMGKGFTKKSKDLEKDKAVAQQGWHIARKAMASGRYHLVVLDEFVYPLKYRMIELREVLAVMADKPRDLHVLVTGRNAPQELMEMSDLVTVMQAVKHPLKAGVKAQRGIEF